ncbi:MAG: GIY-YIG nuclease family protein [Parabacteroides sp.]|nr:GIY-YIG nuclease family protein [Parabacteroides sp.]
MFGYIYITTNKVNGKQYIGKKTSQKFDPTYLGSGIKLKEAVKKYGSENFSVHILCECNSREELNSKEIEYIDHFGAYKSSNFYNISAGGDGGNTYAGKSDSEMREISKKISIANSGSNNGNKGQYVGPKNSMYGKKHTLETRRKISESLKKSNVDRSHPWTVESEEKRSNTLKRFKRYWKVTRLSDGSIFENFTNRMIWIKSVDKESYDKLTKLDKNQLIRDGVLEIGNLVIKTTMIDTFDLSKADIDCYNKLHEEFKSYVYNKRLKFLKDIRAYKSNIN